MLAYVERIGDDWASIECAAAARGLEGRGYTIQPYYSAELGDFAVQADTPVVGDIDSVRSALRRLGRTFPDRLAYLPAFHRLMERPPLYCSLQSVRGALFKGPLAYPVFLKPRSRYGVFPSFVVRDMDDMLSLSSLPDTEPVIQLPALTFLAVYRIFFLSGEVVGMTLLRGDIRQALDVGVLGKLLRYAKEVVQVAYSTDVAVAYFPDRPESIRYPTVVLGSKDVFTMGCTGLSQETYATMLEERWRQLQSISR